MKLVISCEHGGNAVPARYRPLFAPYAPLLSGHRGYDIGALAVAQDLAAAFDAQCFYSTTTRLVVDLNRSLGHPRLFSPATRRLPRASRRELLGRHYLPYRRAVGAQVEAAIRGDLVVHLSCHSFTPVLDGEVREADIGLLFDPRHEIEARLCAAWRSRLLESGRGLQVRRNYPYRGVSDALTTGLRRRFADGRYLGIQLEVNQKHPQGAEDDWCALRGLLAETFERACAVLN